MSVDLGRWFEICFIRKWGLMGAVLVPEEPYMCAALPWLQLHLICCNWLVC